MIGKDEIAEIVRHNDAQSDEHFNDPSQQVAFWRQQDVDVRGVMYVAEQRAMRVVMRDKGLEPHPSRFMPVAFTSAEIAQIAKYAGMWFDAFAAGLEAGRRYPKEKA